MGYLTDAASKRARKIGRRPNLPPWWPLLQIGLGAIVVLFFAYRFIAPDHQRQVSLPPAASPLSSLNTSSSSTNDPTGTTSTSSNNSSTTSLKNVAGASVLVPTGAVEEAKTVATALFTTDFSKVTVYPGQNIPAVSQIWPNPKISSPIVVAAQATSVSFQFVVDPDGPGAAPPRQVAVTVSNTSSTWSWQPGN